MKDNEEKVDALSAVCKALMQENLEEGKRIIQERYPFEKPVHKRDSFSAEKRLQIFLRDGFIDRYTGGRLIFPGVLSVLSYLMPDVFPYHEYWKRDETHQAWWNLFPSVDHIVPLAFGGSNDDDNLLCTSYVRNQAKLSARIEEIGWQIYPPGKLSDWDGGVRWFAEYVGNRQNLMENKLVKYWYDACQRVHLEKYFDTP